MSVQSLERGIQLLRLLSKSDRDGMRLADLHLKTGLSKSTVHRLLETLKSHHFVEQIAETRRYRLGNEIGLLGRAVAQDFDELARLCEASLAQLADETGDTAFLFVRSGLETMCLDRRSGSYPVKAFTVDVGVRRPLGVGASGIAFLALLDDDELATTLAQIGLAMEDWPLARAGLPGAIAAARVKGYAFSDGHTLPDVRGVARIVRGRHGEPVATLGIAAIASRIGAERLPRLVEKLAACVEEAEERIAVGTHHPFRRRREV